MTVNKVILVGRLGRDPEIRTTASGSTVGNMRIATTERRKDRDGNWSDHTEWHTLVLFGKTAENAGKYLAKGRQVYAEGRLQTRKWQDKGGQDRYSTEVVVNVLNYLGSKGDGDSGQSSGSGSYGGSKAGRQSSGGSQRQGNDGDLPFADDDIPFLWWLAPLLPALMAAGEMANLTA